MDELKVWKWSASYGAKTFRRIPPPNWSLLLEHGGKKVQTSGRYAYPSDEDLTASVFSMSEVYTKFERSVWSLVGDGEPEEDYLPRRFKFSIGSWGASDSWEWDGKVLEYIVVPGRGARTVKRTTKRTTPSIEQWREFWRRMDEVKVWKWRARYNAYVRDASSWSLELEYADKMVRSGGSGGGAPSDDDVTAVAGRGGGSEVFKKFQKFRQAVRELADENEPADENDVKAVVRGNNQFALDLYARLRTTESGNLFFSPSSISTALAMTYAGARGETEAQMARALHFSLPQARLHPAFASLTKALESGKKGYQLRIANRLWGQQGYDFLPDFFKLTRDHYGAELGQLDFKQQTEAARQEINQWVEDRTEQKIKDLIRKGDLDALTRLVLTNAIYFKGDWASQFNKKATRDVPFHVTADSKVTVPLMFQKGEFKYAAVEDVQILELPYIDHELSMLVLLPKQVDGLADLESTLTMENVQKWSSSLRKREVNVFLPKFKVTWGTFDLKSPLKALGMRKAFRPGADFSGMDGTKRLFIALVLHKAFVEVNEEGTEAAAATAVIVGRPSALTIFRADHPFLFLIRHNATGYILFLGRMLDPSKAEN